MESIDAEHEMVVSEDKQEIFIQKNREKLLSVLVAKEGQKIGQASLFDNTGDEFKVIAIVDHVEKGLDEEATHRYCLTVLVNKQTR